MFIYGLVALVNLNGLFIYGITCTHLHLNMKMEKLNRVEEIMISAGMVPVFNHADPAVGCRVVQACYDAGLRVFEWTNRGALAAELFQVVADYAASSCPELIMGAGSIFDGNTCRQFHRMGARFIVSPVMEPEMADVCRELDIPWIPGCATPTEIHQAVKLGAGIIKIFPGDAAGGPSFVKAVRGPMPWLKLMPTGGVSPDYVNLKAWFDAGVCCVGMGSKLFDERLVTNPDFSGLSIALKSAIEKIDEIRN
jgi:2-dehydro-3-deoxyphosphogluconate aldolase/(4S)-4-hydroxy-2-oxoglutarate aldolase